MTTRNLYEAAFYKARGIEPKDYEIRERTVYFVFEDTEELKQSREEYLKLDPVFFEVAKLRSRLIDKVRGLRGDRYE
jgi:hypothetical protein